MHENELIRQLRQRVRDPAGMLGIGDDCCVWTPNGRTCLSTDSIVEGRHFRADDEPAFIGRKAAGAALSDLAAMGAKPVGATVAPGSTDAGGAWVGAGVVFEPPQAANAIAVTATSAGANKCGSMR